VKKLGIVFMRYLGSHRGQTPASKTELEQYIASLTPEDKKGLGIENPSEVFTSSRDMQEIVVRYGLQIPPPGPGKPPVVAYEKDGVGHRHLVAYANGGAEEVTAAQLKEMVPDAK